MVLQPIFTIPKKGSAKLHLVNDHSAGATSLNSLIPAEGGFIKLDNLSDLGTNIQATMAKNGGLCPSLLWKLDASQAYQCLPMHPQWQAQQASLIDGEYHVDCCASGYIWCLFFGLVCWIAIHQYGTEDLLHYVDDAFNVTFTDKCVIYCPYN